MADLKSNLSFGQSKIQLVIWPIQNSTVLRVFNIILLVLINFNYLFYQVYENAVFTLFLYKNTPHSYQPLG